MKLIISATVEGISTRQDGTVCVKIGSQEMDSSNAAQLFEFRNKFVKVLISDTNITAPEEALINESVIQDGRKIKSKAQRLRACLYLNWELTDQQMDFEMYYSAYMENLISLLKSKLD